MANSTLMTMLCSAAVVLTATGAAPEHFQPRAKELLADSIELEKNAHCLNVVYFTGNDMQPTAEADRRISELLLYLQQFYGKEMQRNGFGKHSFGLSLTDCGNVDICYIKGKQPHKSYAYGTGHDACIAEVEAWFKANPGKKKSTHTFIIMPTWQDEGYSDKNPGGVPFYGYGRYCFALDYTDFDIRHLGQKTPEGRLLTKWYGGFAHELGHGMNLPHNNGTVDVNKALGTPLMGSGNYTFGMSPTYLTHSSCAILSNTEIFVPAGSTHQFYSIDHEPAVHHVEFMRKGDMLELYLEVSTDVAHINAYVQDPPYAVNQDYEAVAFSCTMGTRNGKRVAGVVIPLYELGNLENKDSGELGLDILIQTYEGSRFRWRIPFDLSKQAAGTPIETGKPTFMRGY
ncbi:MAG: hypothetical protein E7031_03720 [Akkermansiaceae bacterium]|nr:hypothetical protein [Akkermansiaceae bacterium]